MSKKQSEALELADLLQPMMYAVCHNAAIELRRLAEYEQWYEDQVDENNRLRSELAAARGKVESLSVAGGITRADLGFDFDGEAQHHVPKLTVWFTPVPVNGPCDAKGWKDRDALARLLAAAPHP